jgi:hypothetical protein
MELPGGQFIRLGDPCNSRDPRQDFENFLADGMAVPYCTDDSLFNPLNDVRSKILAFDNSDYILDLFLAGSRVHDY